MQAAFTRFCAFLCPITEGKTASFQHAFAHAKRALLLGNEG
jgi:hypothetical protein